MLNNITFDEELNITEAEVDYRFTEAVRMAKEKSKIMGKPTCEFDKERKEAYLLHPNGKREYLDK